MKTTRVRVQDTLSNLPVFSCEQVKAIDSTAIANGTPGYTLMTRAGQSAFDLLTETWPERGSLLVFCGSGNNGGDGYVVAGLAANKGFDVSIISVGDCSKLSSDAASAKAFALGCRIKFYDAGDDAYQALKEISKSGHLHEPFVIVDALLGIGFTGNVRSPYDQCIAFINELDAPVISLDLPSGLNGDLGCCEDLSSSFNSSFHKSYSDAENLIVQADLTLSFIALKKGLCTGAAKNVIGGLYLDDLGVDIPALHDRALVNGSNSTFSATADQILLSLICAKKPLKKRARDSHKGRYGRVVLLGGAPGMGGAILMSAEMCLSAGAGLTSIVTHSSNVTAALVRIPEAMVLALDDTAFNIEPLEQVLNSASAFVCGPGMGNDGWGFSLLERLFFYIQKTPIPVVLDADALNLLAKTRAGPKMQSQINKLPNNCVMTPHPGEAATLLGCSISDVQSDRYSAVRELHDLYGGVVILKGAGTLIFDGDAVYICPYGNPGMSVGGMGDVLSGLVGALLAQGLDAIDAAILGVCAHSCAADTVASREGEIGLRPTQLVSVIRGVLNKAF